MESIEPITDLTNNKITMEQALAITPKRMDELAFACIEIFNTKGTRAEAIIRISKLKDITPVECIYCGFKMHEYLLKKIVPKGFHYLLDTM